MNKTARDIFFLTFFTFSITFTLWLPHILSLPNFWGLNFQNGFNTIYRNFDGLEYIVIAKSFYDPLIIQTLPLSLPASYFASHFPGYSIFISIFAPIMDYLKSMLFVSLLSTVFASWAFYFLVKDFKLSSHPLFLSVIFLVLPARWLIVHSIGSSEPTFILFTISAVYFFMKYEQSKNISDLFITAIWGFLAQITRPQGILLFIALVLYILVFKRFSRVAFKYLPLALIPVGLLAIFYLFSQTYGDFWAYFKSGDNIHLTFPPFPVFNQFQYWVGDIWLEDIVYIFILGYLAGTILIKQKLYPMAFFVLTYLIASSLVAHRDISRYTLPVAPFALIAFEKVLTGKEFRIIFPLVLLIAYLYSQNFILANVAPFPNLERFN